MGKTIIFSHMIKKEIDYGNRVMILVHRDELVNQAIDKLKVVAPDIAPGVVKAQRDQVDAPVIVASVQTLARDYRRDRILAAGPIDLIIVDEAHHAAADTYMAIL